MCVVRVATTTADIQAYGELWSQTPTFTVQETPAGAQLSSDRHERIVLPYTFLRAHHPHRSWFSSPALRTRCHQQSRRAAPIYLVHAPLLAIELGMHLHFPPGAHFNRWVANPDTRMKYGSGLSYPLVLEYAERKMDLAVLPDSSAAIALKLWSDPLRDGWAHVQAADGALRMSWDTGKLPQVACWMNLGGGSADGGEAYYNLGLEPCIGVQDSLAEAVHTHNLYGTVAPYGTYGWWLEIELEARDGIEY